MNSKTELKKKLQDKLDDLQVRIDENGIYNTNELDRMWGCLSELAELLVAITDRLVEPVQSDTECNHDQNVSQAD